MMRTLIKSTVKMRARFSIIEDFRRLGLYTSGFLAFITNASIALSVERQTMNESQGHGFDPPHTALFLQIRFTGK